MSDRNLYGDNDDNGQREDELVEFEHYEAYLTAESVEHLRRLLGKSVKKIYSQVVLDRNGEAVTSVPLNIEVDSGHLVLDINPKQTDMHYFFFVHFSATFMPLPEGAQGESTEETVARLSQKLKAVAISSDSPIRLIEIYEGRLEDAEHYESASFDQVVVFRQQDGQWFAVSAKPGDENLAIEVLEDEDRLNSIINGNDREYASCHLRLTAK